MSAVLSHLVRGASVHSPVNSSHGAVGKAGDHGAIQRAGRADLMLTHAPGDGTTKCDSSRNCQEQMVQPLWAQRQKGAHRVSHGWGWGRSLRLQTLPAVLCSPSPWRLLCPKPWPPSWDGGLCLCNSPSCCLALCLRLPRSPCPRTPARLWSLLAPCRWCLRTLEFSTRDTHNSSSFLDLTLCVRLSLHQGRSPDFPLTSDSFPQSSSLGSSPQRWRSEEAHPR